MNKLILSLLAAIVTVGGMLLTGWIISEILMHYSVWVVIVILALLALWVVWFTIIDED